MTNKERVDILYDLVETKLKNSSSIIEFWSHLEYIKEDLDRLERLERLEAAFKIICEELDISLAEIEGDYTIIANWCSSGVSKRKGKLLKEVLENENK